MDMEEFVWQAWRDLRETAGVWEDWPTLAPYEAFHDVVRAARMAVQFAASDADLQLELPFFGD